MNRGQKMPVTPTSNTKSLLSDKVSIDRDVVDVVNVSPRGMSVSVF